MYVGGCKKCFCELIKSFRISPKEFPPFRDKMYASARDIAV